MGPEVLSNDGQGGMVNPDTVEDSSGMTRSTANSVAISEDRGKDDRVSIGSRPDSGAISANDSHPMEPFQNISESVPAALQLQPNDLQLLREKERLSCYNDDVTTNDVNTDDVTNFNKTA